MTQTRTYNITVTITVDDADADVLLKIDKLYKSGQMDKRAANAIVNSIKTEGYQGVHRTILARQGLTYGKGMCCDHIDSNPGNNTRANLRVVTYSQNQQARAISQGNPHSPYAGVQWHKRGKKWRAFYIITNEGRKYTKHIGLFLDEVEAAKAYDKYIIDNKIDKPLNFKEGHDGNQANVG